MVVILFEVPALVVLALVLFVVDIDIEVLADMKVVVEVWIGQNLYN